LFNEFQGQQEQQIPEPGIPAGNSFAAPAGAVQATGEGQWHDGTRITSGNMSFSTLSSGLSSAGLSPGWSDARPWVQCGCGLTNYQFSPQRVFTGVSSGFSNHSSLCSGQQTCASWSPPVSCLQTPPVNPSVSRTAYCYGCMQFGMLHIVC